MKAPAAALRVLVIEDTRADMLLIERELLRHGLHAEATQAATASQVAQQLDRRWDVIVSDYHVPGVDFLHTLARVRQMQPPVPLILVSGALGEDKAVDLIKRGVADFVNKDRLARLVPAIERVLREAGELRALHAAEQALRDSEHRNRLLFERSPLPKWVFDAESFAFLDVNDRAAERYGWTREEMLALAVDDIQCEPDRGRFAAWLRRQGADDASSSDLLPVRHRDRHGREIDVELYCASVPFNGRPAVLSVVLDVTERKRAARELVEADRRKDEFLATLAHELRNPLAPLSNALQILTRSDDPRTAAQLRAMMDRQVAQLVRLVDDLLEVSRITSGKLKLHSSRVELPQVLEAAIENARPQIDAQHHRLLVEQPAQVITLDGDPVRLAQVFTNLLNNAAKYSEPGGTISVRVAVPAPDRVRVSVHDSGIGIDPGSLPRVFDLFSQVDDGRDKSQGGLGIGLSLAKRLVEMHGGSIDAHSAGKGRGATFSVELPAAVSAAADARRPLRAAQAPASSCRIVVADDNRDAADTLAMMLRLSGHDVHTAYDGREALAAIRSRRPEVAILDLGMPELDGYEVARALRAESCAGSLLLIALTGWGQDADRRRTEAAGFDHHFTKPLNQAALDEVLARRCSSDTGSAEVPGKGEAPASRPAR